MIPPTIVTPISLVAPPSLETGQGGALAKFLFSGDPSLPQSPPALQFAQLLGAATSQIAQLAQTEPDPSALSGDAMVEQAALAELGSQLDELVAQLMAAPDATPMQEVVQQFLHILQGFEFANGSNAIEVLAANLGALDEEGLVQLDAVARTPAALITVLAEMAGIPRRESVVSLGQSFPVLVPKPLQSHVASFTPISKSQVFTAEKGISSGAISAGPIVPNARQTDTRALVMGALVAASTGAEREVPLSPTMPTDMRAISTSLTAALRPAEPALPQASGFARNLAQQIRSANISEGNTRIALAPRGLGEIEIDLRPDEAGKLRIILRAENPAVLQALRGDRDGLLLALQDGGATVDDAELEFEDFSRKQQRTDEMWEDMPALNPDADAEHEPQNAAPHTGRIGAGILDILT